MGTENIRGSASETLSLVQFGPVVLIGNDQVIQDLLGHLGTGHGLAEGQSHSFW